MKTKRSKKRAETTRRLKIETLETRRLLAFDATALAALTNSEFAESANVAEITNAAEAGEEPWYVLSASLNPSAEEQETLEQINRFRADPAGELDRIFSSITETELIARNPLVAASIGLYDYPRKAIDTFLNEWNAISSSAPLAFNAALQSSATAHSRYMIARNDVAHQVTGEKTLEARVVNAGFDSGLTTESGAPALGENVGGMFAKNGDFSVASYILAAFSVDWAVPSHSHRDTLTNAAYSEIGISVSSTSKSIGPYVTTCDFGTSVAGARTDGAYLLGVVYDDGDKDAFYDVGEGVGAAKITIERVDGSETPQTVEIASASVGGYQIFLSNGTYKVTVAGEGFATPVAKTVSINDGENAKLDFRTSDAGAIAPVVDLNGDAEGSGLRVVFDEGSNDPFEMLAASNLSITDADSASLYGAKIYFQTRPDAIDESLDISVSGTNLRASLNQSGGYVSLSGVGTLAEYEDAIASLTYFNAKELCDLTDRVVLISVYDGVFWSDETALTIGVRPTNLPKMTVQEMVAYEGDEGSSVATFSVELDAPARLDVSFNYRVVVGRGTALEGEAFTVSLGDPITIAAGESSATIECFVLGNFDALKPEGLAAVEGGFENPATYFYLEIVDVENAYLTNEEALVKGTIFDDDSPIILGEIDKYEFASALSTDLGRRRYVFTLTPETSGLFAWNADSLGVADGMNISVRKESLDSEPIVVSESTDVGQKAQWFADPDVEYWITVECADDFNDVAARLLPITDENVVLVDPLLGDAEDELLSLFWTDDGLDVAVDNFTWSLDSDFFANSDAAPTFRTEKFPNAELLFGLPPEGGGSVSAGVDGGTTWTSADGGELVSSGFSSITYWGGGRRETLAFVGSDGDDYLYYSNGSGYFETDGKTYKFNSVNSVSIDAGSAGNDVAYVEDTAFDETLKTTNDSFGLYGGGYSLIAKNFTNMKICFVNGGSDAYLANDFGDDVAAVVAKSKSIVSGTFGADDETLRREYSRLVSSAADATFAPTESISSVAIFGDDSSGVYYDAQVGSVRMFDRAVNATTTVYNAKKLTISGVPESAADRFEVVVPDAESEITETETTVSIVDSKGWSLSVPAWKKLTVSASAAMLTEKERVFENRNDSDGDDFDALQFDELDLSTLFVSPTEKNDAFFETLGFCFGNSSDDGGIFSQTRRKRARRTFE